MFFYNSIFGVGNNFSIFCVVYFNSLLLWVELKVIGFFRGYGKGSIVAWLYFKAKNTKIFKIKAIM